MTRRVALPMIAGVALAGVAWRAEQHADFSKVFLPGQICPRDEANLPPFTLNPVPNSASQVRHIDFVVDPA